jgi:MFS family permease
MYLVASIFVAMAIAIQNVIYNLYLVSMGYDAGIIGRVTTSVALGVAIIGIPAGIFYDQKGSKITFSLAVIGMSLAIIFRAFSTTQPMLLLWAFLNGAFNAFYFVAIFPFLTKQSSQTERPHLFGANMAVWTTFTMLGSFAGGFLPDIWLRIYPQLGETLSLRYSLAGAAILNLIALIPLYLLHSTPRKNIRVSARSLLPSPVSRNAMLAGAVILVLTGLVIGLTMPFMNIYLAQTFNSPTKVIGLVYSASQLMGLFSAFIGPMVIHRFGLVAAPVFLMLLNAPIILAIGLPVPFLLVVIAFLLSVGIERMADLGLMNLIMVAVFPADRGAMSGIRLITNYGAQAFAGILGGALILSAGYSWLFATAACIEILAGVMVWTLFHRRETFSEQVTTQ